MAVWFHHPLFRRDLTPVTTDDRPSLSTFMDEADPTRKIFDREYFRMELEKRPPAFIDLFQLVQNYPPGWVEVAEEFLKRSEGLYVPVESPIIPGNFFFIRKDLYKPPVLTRFCG